MEFLVLILETALLIFLQNIDFQLFKKFFKKNQKKCLCISKMVVPLHPQSKAIKVLFKVGPVVQFG